jgi:hypothetical protein
MEKLVLQEERMEAGLSNRTAPSPRAVAASPRLMRIANASLIAFAFVFVAAVTFGVLG